MVLTMNLPHTMIEFYEVFEETLREKEMHGEITKMHEHIDQKRKPVEYLKELILASGFAIRSIQVDGFKMKYTDGSAFLNHYFIRKAFMESWKAILPTGQADSVFGILEQKLNQIAIEKGELIMSVPYVCFDCVKSKPVLP
jgi:hypothetical protein